MKSDTDYLYEDIRKLYRADVSDDVISILFDLLHRIKELEKDKNEQTD